MNGRKLIYGMVLVAMLVASGFTQNLLTRDRETLGLTRTAVISNAPPVLAFTTVALGGFRGLIANTLWIRTSQLQEEGKYFEAVQLADWITTLQPHFTQVWLYQGWNMAYNISVKFPNPEDRWLWVQRGLELLRDRGLAYNPNQALMYRELAWFFQHKMGANLDDAHWLYKTEWAKMMDEVIPGGRPNYADLLSPTNSDAKARVEKLVSRYKMDPVMMKKVDDTYGPLEWRLPETHAIYWGMVGVEHASDQDKMPLRRTIFQPMLTAFHRGKIVTNRFAKRIEVVPNLLMVTNASKAYEDSIQAEPAQADHIARAHRNFIKDAVYFLYINNKPREAQYWFHYVTNRYGFGPQVGITNYTMADYALSRVQEDVNETSRDRQTAILQGLLSQAFYNYAVGEEDAAQGAENMVARIYALYASKTSNNKAKDRVELPALTELKRTVLLELLRPAPEVSEEFQAALRSRLGLPANFGVPATNAPPAQPPPP